MTNIGAKSISAISGGISAAFSTGAFLILSHCQLYLILDFFQKHLREPLFIGLLTVAAFLFSLKTFIIVTMKENVYGTTAYEKKWRKALELSPGLKRYAGLERFSLLLFSSVLISLIAAVLQFTLGLVDEPYAAIISIGSAIWSIAMIFVSLFYLQINLRSWFKFLDDSAT